MELPYCSERIESVVADLERQGWSVQEGYLSREETKLLREECLAWWQEGAFRRAGIGQGEEYQLRRDIRGDHILWLDAANLTPSQALWAEELQRLRLGINRELFIGLFEYEGHFAIYPPGAFYKRHLDNFQETDARTVTVVLYLNPEWEAAAGGQLRLYLNEHDEEGNERFVDVQPKSGTVAVFLSRDFPHEVLPCRRERLSLTGWFRTRSLEAPLLGSDPSNLQDLPLLVSEPCNSVIASAAKQSPTLGPRD